MLRGSLRSCSPIIHTSSTAGSERLAANLSLRHKHKLPACTLEGILVHGEERKSVWQPTFSLWLPLEYKGRLDSQHTLFTRGSLQSNTGEIKHFQPYLGCTRCDKHTTSQISAPERAEELGKRHFRVNHRGSKARPCQERKRTQATSATSAVRVCRFEREMLDFCCL